MSQYSIQKKKITPDKIISSVDKFVEEIKIMHTVQVTYQFHIVLPHIQPRMYS